MFTNQRYIEVNREERHFCALFVHALLSSGYIRTNFTELISSKCNIKLDPERMEIFLEAAALRDYWKDLGDSKKYDNSTHDNRRHVLNRIVEDRGYSASIIDEYPFFWTNGIDGNKTKLWSPSHWSSSAIEKSPLPDLINVKWAFNAKPDIMIISNDYTILIEGKLESSEGKYGASGQGQEETQRLIAHLLKELVPAFSQIEFHNLLLALRSPKNERWPLYITWEDVIKIVEPASLDTFTQECFKQLQIRYYANN